MQTPLSNSDIKDALGNVEIMTHEDLKKFKNGKQLWDFVKRKPIALLFEYLPNYGHWVGILRTKIPYGSGIRDAIEIFDSYGKKPDDQPTHGGTGMTDKDYDKQLTKLLMTVPRDILISYNHYPKQGDTQTCGRWIISRMLNNYLPLKMFNQTFRDDKDVLEYTRFLLGK